MVQTIRYIRNPATGRSVLLNGRIGRSILANQTTTKQQPQRTNTWKNKHGGRRVSEQPRQNNETEQVEDSIQFSGITWAHGEAIVFSGADVHQRLLSMNPGEVTNRVQRFENNHHDADSFMQVGPFYIAAYNGASYVFDPSTNIETMVTNLFVEDEE
jgi:hypothetical protein